MKITSVMWGSYSPVLKRAAAVTGTDCRIYPTRVLEEYPEKVDEAVASMQTSDVILVYHTSDLFWERMDRELATLREKVPVISLGPDPSFWGQSTVDPVVVTTCQRYITNSGEENFVSLLLFIKKELFHEAIEVLPPTDLPWEGIYHPDAPAVFRTVDDYLAW